MSMTQTFVIVGGGLAGAKAAEALREEGFDGRVVLLGEEDVAPYERPPLSKDYLRGDAGRDAIWAHEEGWYDAHDVELRTGTTRRPSSRSARPRSCSTAASGSGSTSSCSRPARAAKRLPIAGADLDGVHVLRTVDDSDAPARGAGARACASSSSARAGSAARSRRRRSSAAPR